MDEYTHHLDSEIGRSELMFLARFGAPPIFGAKDFDRVNKKSLYCNELSKKRP